MNCFHCRCQIEFKQLISFRETCPRCEQPVHVCLNCHFYDPSFNNQCREPQAERVVDKDRANFCEYFSPRTAPEPERVLPANDARAKLDALFKKKG
jgi:hypothetical protein